MRKSRILWTMALLAGLALVGLLGAAIPIQAQAPGGAWAQVDAGLPDYYNLNAVFMTNGTDGAWVAGSLGEGGVVERLFREGDRWRSFFHQSFRAPVHGIVAINPTDVWAVGENGLILHGDLGGFREVPNPLPTANLTSIQMLGQGEEGWAGGSVGSGSGATSVLLHFSKGVWQQEPGVTGTGAITALHLAAGTGWAVSSGQPATWHYQAGIWTPVGTPDCPPGSLGPAAALNGVRVLASGDAWAVGYCDRIQSGPDVLLPRALHWQQGAWLPVLPEQPIADLPPVASQSSLLALSFSPDGFGLAVGVQHVGVTSPAQPYALSYRADGRWHYEPLAVPIGVLNAVSQADSAHALAVGDHALILSYGYGGPAVLPTHTPTPVPPWGTPTPAPAPNPPTARVPDPHRPGVLYFPLVGHTLQGGFRIYWESHGGLAQFGYPLTEEFPATANGHTYTIQYFERARFEWHPENAPPYDILLGLLGRETTADRQNEAPFQPYPAQPGSRSLYFSETQHNLAPQFLAYWRDHGGLPVYGYPISEAFTEVSKTDGKPYLVQYFERNRLEYHPELPPAFQVSLGLLGVDQLRSRGWLP